MSIVSISEASLFNNDKWALFAAKYLDKAVAVLSPSSRFL